MIGMVRSYKRVWTPDYGPGTKAHTRYAEWIAPSFLRRAVHTQSWLSHLPRQYTPGSVPRSLTT